jgi:glycosyltransferase involved in cell wall biosynthesis
MKIILCIRDLKWGIGRHVIKFIRILEKREDIEKILLLTSAEPDFFGPKVEVRTLRLAGGTFITKEPHFALQCTAIIKKTLKEEHYDIIDLRQPALVRSLKKFDASIVYNVHVTHFQFSREAPGGLRYLPVKILHGIFKWFEYLQFKWADNICFVSRRTQREFSRLYPKLAKKTRYIANFRDMSLFFPISEQERLAKRKALNIADRQLALLYCGRLDRMKNIDSLLEAFSAVRKTRPTLTLLVAGTGSQASRLSGEPGVIPLGQLEPSQLNEVYNAADCTILPSLYENFPGVVLESIAAGTPVISTNVGDVGEWLPPELMIEDFDKDSLARKIDDVAGMNGSKLEDHVHNLRDRLRTHHDAEANTIEKLDLYKELAAHHPIVYFSIRELPSRMASSVHIMKMCQALQQTGNDVMLVAAVKDDPNAIFDHYGIKTRFFIRRAWAPGTTFKPLRIIGWLYFLIKAVLFTRRQKPRLIYVRDLFSGVLFNRLGIPFIYECHEDPIQRLKKFFLKRTLNSKNLKLVVTISESLKRIVTEKYERQLSQRKVIVAHDGVDLSGYPEGRSHRQLRQETGLPEEGFLVGYTGSLYKGRGIDIILSVAGKNPGLQFIIIGGSPKEVRCLEKESAASGLQNIHLTGHVPHHMVPRYLASMDILLMPYQRKVTLQGNKRDTAKYMSPLKMFEYMAAGAPIISSDLPVIHEVLQDGRNALLVEPADPGQWHDAVLRLGEDRELAARLAQNARQDVQQYTWDQRAVSIIGSLK